MDTIPSSSSSSHIDLANQVALDQALCVLGAREDDVVLDAGAELGHHRRHRVEVRLTHLDPVALLESLHEIRVDVLGVVEVDEVAVDPLLDRLLGLLLRAAARVADTAAREPGGDRQARAALQ
jgi:hypothetical protein